MSTGLCQVLVGVSPMWSIRPFCANSKFVNTFRDFVRITKCRDYDARIWKKLASHRNYVCRHYYSLNNHLILLSIQLLIAGIPIFFIYLNLNWHVDILDASFSHGHGKAEFDSRNQNSVLALSVDACTSMIHVIILRWLFLIYIEISVLLLETYFYVKHKTFLLNVIRLQGYSWGKFRFWILLLDAICILFPKLENIGLQFLASGLSFCEKHICRKSLD